MSHGWMLLDENMKLRIKTKNGGQLYNQRNSIAPKYWNKYRVK
jgi:hypothetical protein